MLGLLHLSNCNTHKMNTYNFFWVSAEISNNHAILLAALENRAKELEEYSRNDVFHQQHSLGIPVRVKGKLNEFMGKNFIFCYHIKQIPEEEYFQHLHQLILVYKFRNGKT